MLLLITSYIVLLLYPSTVLSILVDTPLGKLQGKTEQYNGTIVYKFLGVPYAKPPLNELMLEKPQPIEPWQGIKNATEYGPACVQTGYPKRQSLDCLMLNVFIPNILQKNNTLPVMLYIHGGSYMHGTGNDYDGSSLAVTGNVIIVTINYRLDAFGFMSTKDDAIRGNFGLWDQRLAIIWVKENIHSFGGNGNKITIFGESAGSYSLGMHMLSSANIGLFQRVLSESGVAVSPIGLTYDAKSYAKSVSDSLNCTVLSKSGTWNTTTFKVCFKRQNVKDILLASNKAGDFGVLAYRRILGPVVDGDFITASPIEALHRNGIPFKNVDLMVGTNSAEGGLLLGPLSRYQSLYGFSLKDGIPESVFRHHIALAISRDYYQNRSLILEKITNMYSFPSVSDIDQARQSVNMYGDFILQAPSVETLEYHSHLATNQNTYQYYFTHVPEKRKTYSWFQGANHADELQFVFGPSNYSSQTEIKFSNDLHKYWTNFASYGNPNGRNGEDWPQFNKETRHYMQLDTKHTVRKDLLPDRIHFWRYELPKIVKNLKTVIIG